VESLVKAGMGSVFPISVTIGARRKMQLMEIATTNIATAITNAEN